MTSRIISLCWVVLFVLVLFLNIARFLFLKEAPPGFYIDESARAATALCLRETQRDLNQNKFPLFPDLTVGDKGSPSDLYLSAIWSKVFGASIGAFRAIPATVILLTILGLALLIHQTFGRAAAGLAVVLASASPWAFQFSRIYWDAPWVSLFLVWGCYFFWCRSTKMALIAGISFSLAMYSYPPARAYVPLLLCILLFFSFQLPAQTPKTNKYPKYALLLWGFVLASIPLGLKIYSGELMERASALTIFSHPALQQTLAPTFFDNYSQHLTFNFLLGSGDTNLRHSTQYFGILSWPECLGIALIFLGLVALVLTRNKVQRKIEFTNLQRQIVYVSLCAAFATFLPAALTFESLPHALRSFCGWIFFPLLGSIGLSALVGRANITLPLITLLSVIWSALFLDRYFHSYPETALAAFENRTTIEAREYILRGDFEGFLKRNESYPDAGKLYFLMSYGNLGCDEAGQLVAKFK